jgi:membrane protein DedA with SNARE-associated domain
MTDYVLALIPQYGLYLIFAVVVVACCGIPLPLALVVLTSGALAAAGDLVLWQVIAVVCAGYWIGDQIAFFLARNIGPSLLTRLRGFKRLTQTVDRAENMLLEKGAYAVFLSHTVVSPTGPYVSYVSGAVQMNWFKFTSVAVPAATLWTLAYTSLGYVFAGELPQLSDLMISMSMVGVATLSAIGFAIWLGILWHNFELEDETNLSQV